ncbi:hypothetical protein [Rhodoferax sp.]|uniref:hypothetical protein n=1 Tax=Rhodoferax sp. TaxID=50421 RepID=UPI0028477EA3|nr:hypothetical protein [Rhodoferax sp.]MDR3372013.1 hypothetical protein [Rhodoferax sp.]
MNRCFTSLKTPALVLAFFLASAACLSPSVSQAQTEVRQFPDSALRGMLEVTTPPQILINGQAERLSPGARIKAQNNLIVMSGTLVGQSLLVNYVRNQQGLIQDVWILTAAEAQQKRKGMDSTNIVFASDADKPKTDDGKTPFDQLPTFPQQ